MCLIPIDDGGKGKYEGGKVKYFDKIRLGRLEIAKRNECKMRNDKDF